MYLIKYCTYVHNTKILVSFNYSKHDMVILTKVAKNYLIQNSPAVKKMCGHKRIIAKKDMKSKVVAKKWLWWWANFKTLIATIQVNLCRLLHVPLGFGTKFTWIVVITNFAIRLENCSILVFLMVVSVTETVWKWLLKHWYQCVKVGDSLSMWSNWSMWYSIRGSLWECLGTLIVYCNLPEDLQSYALYFCSQEIRNIL